MVIDTIHNGTHQLFGRRSQNVRWPSTKETAAGSGVVGQQRPGLDLQCTEMD